MENKNIFYLDCPAFDEPLREIIPHEYGKITSAMANKNYALPIDAGVIKVLDQPGVKTVMSEIVSWGIDFHFASVIEDSIPVSDHNFPEINAIVKHCVQQLGINRPTVVVSQSTGLNAYTIGNDKEPYIVLGSVLVNILNKDQLTFVIGHECGHIAMGHLIWSSAATILTNFAGSLPVIGNVFITFSNVALNSWSRRSEISADRAGYLCCQNLDQSKRALIQINSGFLSADYIDIDDYIKNIKRFRNGAYSRRFSDFERSHPIIPKRIEAMDLFAKSELYYEILGLPVPSGSIGRDNLNQSVERIIKAMGRE